MARFCFQVGVFRTAVQNLRHGWNSGHVDSLEGGVQIRAFQEEGKPVKACAILSVENGLWILEGSRGGIDNDVVDDGGIAFSIHGEETEWALTKGQS